MQPYHCNKPNYIYNRSYNKIPRHNNHPSYNKVTIRVPTMILVMKTKTKTILVKITVTLVNCEKIVSKVAFDYYSIF